MALRLGGNRRLRCVAAALVSTTALGAVGAVAAQAAGPVAAAPPRVAGKAIDGKRLKAAGASFDGVKPFTYGYAWERCDAAGSSCAPIEGATSATYVATSSDVGHRLAVIVTASNSEGSAQATSAASAKIAPAAPKHKGAGPAIAGAAQEGQQLTASPGGWTGSPPLSFAYQWQSCTGSTCSPIPGAGGASYRPGSAQSGHKLRVLVTATNGGGSSSKPSKKTAAVAPGPPVNTGQPTVAGLPIVEQTLTAEVGDWAGTAPFTYTYQWRSCNLAGDCQDISGAHEPTYTVGPLQIANSIEVVVTAHNAQGSSSATSEPTNLISALLPKNLGLPSIAGLLQDGGLLSVLTGSWEGTEPLDFSYVWELCNSAGLECEQVKGALGSTLGLLGSMVGQTARVIVTATNSAGSTSATSEPTSLIKALLPSNLGLPSIGGLLQDGSLLSVLTGSWSGTGPLSYTYQWERCDAAGANCEAIGGETGSTLKLLTGLIGSTVRVAVTATNSGGSSTATSPATSLVKALLPSNIGLPSITGLLEDGGLLSAVEGTWSGSGPLDFSYAWELCNSAGGACQPISGALGSTLSLASSFVGKTVRLAVTATNEAGSSTATSEPTSLIGALLPSNLKLPSITGLLQDGSSLTGLLGSWSGTEPSFAFQWQHCNAAGAECADIKGATGSTLGLVESLIGGTVRLLVTATNSAGSTTAASQPTGLVKALLPSNTALPSIGGLLEDAQTLTGGKGSWSGSAASFDYQWLLCNAGGGECKEASGATGTTFGLLGSMIGKTVRLAVTATNSAGAVTATSEPSSPVLAILPSIVSLPSIGGLLEDGQTVTGGKGTWNGSEPSYSYQWKLCNGSGGECNPISGATGTTLGLLTGEIGKTVRLAVTASNSRGSATAESAPSSPVLAILPKLLSLPQIGGLAEDGQTLTGAKGSWSGSEPSFAYQWLSCNAGGGECSPVSNATGTTFGLGEALIGRTVRLAVTASNSRGSATAESAPTSGVLAILPSKATAPSIAGILQVGKILEVVPNGEWAGSEKPKAKWQWQTCGLLGKENECTSIGGAIAKTLKLELTWIGLTVRVVESATNSRGTVTKSSPITSTILGLLLSPTKGTAEGGTAVTLAAPGVSKATAVNFGGTSTSEIEVDSPGQITVTAPPGSEGTVPVTVSTPEGTTHATPETQFTYTGE